MAYERLKDPLAPARTFYMRLARNVALVLALVGLSLAGGMWGYHALEGMAWIDAFANAAMILSGMGPLAALHSDHAKLFAGAYAIYSGLFLVFASSMLIAPLLHRFLHRMHLADDSDDGAEKPARKR